MKKPSKPAPKKVIALKKPAPKLIKKPVLKPAQKSLKKPVLKPDLKLAAKKSVKKIEKTVAKKAIKKVVNKAVNKAPLKKEAAKKVFKKPAPKLILPKKGNSPKSNLKPPLSKIKAVSKNIQKKIQDKIAASKKAVAIKLLKKEDAIKKGKGKKILAPVIVATATGKTSKKEEVKKALLKPAKKLTKKEEKELLKSKGKKGAFDFEAEEIEAKSRTDEDDDTDEDFDSAAPKKIKMTFDEDIEEVLPVRKKNKSGLDDDIKENLAEEILALAEDFSMDEVFTSIRNMNLFKLESDECVVRGCDNPSTTSGYCRYHYIKMWKDVKKKELILSEGRLAKIIEDLVRKYPMKYVEAIIHDLADDKAFNLVLKDLDIETDENEIDAFDDDELLDDDQDIAFETKVVKPSFDD